MPEPRDTEFVFVPQQQGGYHLYSPAYPGLHSEGDTLGEAMDNAREALDLYLEGCTKRIAR